MGVATLTWTTVPGATGYKVEYKRSSDPSFTLHNSNVTTTSIAIPGLEAGTSYDFRVTTHCSTGDAAPQVIVGITNCEAATVNDAFIVTDATQNVSGGSTYNGVAANRRHSSYGNLGTKIYSINGYQVTGEVASGYSTTDITSAGYFMNNISNNTLYGRLNNVGLWGANNCTTPTFDPIANEFIGFTRAITVPSTKYYYIGIGADNIGKITVDNATIIQNPGINALNFRWWHIYPIQLTAGTHIIGLYGSDDGATSASFGAEIYNNTATEIANATSLTDLNLIYSTEWEFCRPFNAGTTIGYSCPAGYLLDTSGDFPVCVKHAENC